MWDSTDQAAHYHDLGPKLGALSLTRNLAGLGIKVVFIGTWAIIHLSDTSRLEPLSYLVYKLPNSIQKGGTDP
jgi:hypothetical protein